MKMKVVPSYLLNSPENPGRRWDARYLMVVADLLNPELTVAEVTDMILNPEDKKHRMAFGDLMRAADSESGARLLAQKFGAQHTPRIAARLSEIFQELLRRHRGERRSARQAIDTELADLDRRFGAEDVAEALIGP